MEIKIMLKHKKTLIICGLAIISIVLIGLLIAMSQPPDATDDLNDADILASDVTPRDITEPPVDIAPIIPIDPPTNTTDETETEQTTEVVTDGGTDESVNNIELTVIEPKPEPPEKPDTAAGQDITDPDKKPQSITVPPVEPTQSNENMPKNGDTNEQCQVYVEGFGWVTQGGDNVREDSQSDGDWDKQIGQMN